MDIKVSGSGLQRQVIFWLLVLAAFIAFLMVFSSILLPFIGILFNEQHSLCGRKK